MNGRLPNPAGTIGAIESATENFHAIDVNSKLPLLTDARTSSRMAVDEVTLSGSAGAGAMVGADGESN